LVTQMALTPGLRSIMIPAGSSMPAILSEVRLASGMVMNGQVFTANSAQSRWQGGSAETRLTTHIGPMTKHLKAPRVWPHIEHFECRMAMASLTGSATGKSGSPSSHGTNHGTG